MSISVLKIHSADNVIVALKNLTAKTEVELEGEHFTMLEDIQAKHKFYTEDLELGSPVTMYGVLVGKVTKAVKKGELMSTQNLQHAAEPYVIRNSQFQWIAPDVSKWKDRKFMGYHRKDGSIGTANYWLFIPTVFCENRNLDVIKEALYNELGYAVTDKYKSFAKALLQAYREGKPLTDTIDFSAAANHLVSLKILMALSFLIILVAVVVQGKMQLFYKTYWLRMQIILM
jgi:altronate hydrolase